MHENRSMSHALKRGFLLLQQYKKMEKTLKIAIQKKGRLNEESIQLLKQCGVKFNNGRDQLKVTSHSFPAELLFLRNSDIPNSTK